MELNTGHLLAGGRYRIERVLGQGGFGITYLAEQTGLARKVAIKEFFMKELCNREGDTSHVTVPSMGSREMVDRFREKFIKEARAIARLSHKHIVRIIDVFEENNTAYYVMEYVGGGSLGEKSKGCALPEEVAVRYIRQVASALDYVHSQRMMHLDVKPGNVLLNSDDEAVLIDFGLSKQYDMSGEQTSSTPVGISHGYAPLEQYKRGGVGTFSPATDIYSLGATLYRLLTGETPPEAGDVNDEGLPALPGNVSAPVRKAVEAAMQPRRKDRPQSIDEFIALLDGSSAGVISNDSEKSQTPDDDGETVVSFDNSSSTLGGEVSRSDGGEKSQSVRPVISNGSEKSQNKSVKEEILRSAQDDKGAKKDEPADRVISNGSEKSQNTPFNKKWIAIVAVALLVVIALIIGVNWYGDYRAAEAERLQAEIALAEQQAEQQRLETARLAQEEAARQAKEEAERIAAENKRNEEARKAREEAERKRKEEEERKRKEAARTRGTINGHDYVDLGLSVKWATCNVGASSPGDYGNHYAWGETSTKSSYDTDNSATYGKQMGSIAGNPTYDVARKKWGSPWRLPTKAEFDELVDNCTWTWTTQNGHNGYKVTSKKNGNSIFLPAAGYRDGTSSGSQGTDGYYWSATPYKSGDYGAYYLYFYEGYRYSDWFYSFYGRSVRPVSQN